MNRKEEAHNDQKKPRERREKTSPETFPAAGCGKGGETSSRELGTFPLTKAGPREGSPKGKGK